MKCTEPGCDRGGFKNILAIRMHVLRAHRGMKRTFPNKNKPAEVIPAPALFRPPQPTTIGELVKRADLEAPAHHTQQPKVINGITIPAIKRSGVKGERMDCPVPGCGYNCSTSYMGNHLRAEHGIFRRKSYKARNGKPVKGSDTPAPAAEPVPLTSDRLFAVRIQALVQLGELIATLKG